MMVKNVIEKPHNDHLPLIEASRWELLKSVKSLFDWANYKIQKALGCKGNPLAYDVTSACSGFLLGLVSAACYIRGGGFNNVLVIGADVLSRYVDWTDREMCILFGDAAGAVVVQEALEKRHEESLEPGAILLIQEQLSIEILGKKSGYLKGFGVGPKPSSSRSSVTAHAHTEVVSSLQKELESLKNFSKVQQEQIAAQNLVAQEQAKMIEMQNKRFEEIEKFMRMTKDQASM